MKFRIKLIIENIETYICTYACNRIYNYCKCCCFNTRKILSENIISR